MTMLPTNVLHVMSDDQLDKLIQKAIQEGFERGQKRNYEKPLNMQEAANYLGIHVKSLSARFSNGKLPSSLRHVAGGRIYLFASELQEFIKRS